MVMGLGEQVVERMERVDRAAQHLAHDIQIVKLTSPDEDPELAEEIARFSWREFDNKPDPSPGRVERRVNSLRGRTAVAAVDEAGKIRAIGLETIDTEKGVATVDEVVTAADSRGQGLGGAVVTTLENEAKSRGVNTVNLDPVDLQARRFYEKLGYQTDAEDELKLMQTKKI